MERLTELRAIGDIQKLDEAGFWSEAQKIVGAMLDGYRRDLEAEGNSRDRDLIIKGKILGAKQAITKLDSFIKALQVKIGQ